MKKFLAFALPIATLVIFVVIMLSGNILKKPMGDDDNIPKYISDIMDYVLQDNWETASETTEKLADAWKKVVRRIQFSSERNEINGITISIARLQGAVLAKDKSNALMELKEAYTHWEDLAR